MRNIFARLEKLLLSTLIFSFFFVFNAKAAEEEKPKTDGSEYSFSWLDPDKKINVVQNRKYTKANQIEVVLSGGVGMGETYRNSYVVMPRMFYYFNESFGLSLLGAFTSNSDNNNLAALKQASSTIPSVRDIKAFYGGSVVWIPFYAKINTFNHIFYFDWSFEAGAASVKSEIDLNNRASGLPNLRSGNYTGYFWGTGQKFFITRNFATRLDFMGLYYSAPSALNTVLNTDSVTNSHYYFTLGLSYTF